MLAHTEVDAETKMTLKVVFNIFLRLKQRFRDNKDLAETFKNNLSGVNLDPDTMFHEDKPIRFIPSPMYQNVVSFNALERLILESTRGPDAPKGNTLNFLDRYG
jgi:hypothetical protein